MVIGRFLRWNAKRLFPLALSFPLILVACNSDAPPDAGSEDKETPDKPVGDGPLDGLVTVDRLPTPDDPVLVKGRSVWSGTCHNCHGLGIADSPKITDRKAWAPRIAKGKNVLYEHALHGFFGPDGAMMPERGGNPDLSDDEIRAAVDFMVANSQ